MISLDTLKTAPTSPFLSNSRWFWKKITHSLCLGHLIFSNGIAFAENLACSSLDQRVFFPSQPLHPECCASEDPLAQLHSMIDKTDSISALNFLNLHKSDPQFPSLLEATPEFLKNVFNHYTANPLPRKISNFLKQHQKQLVKIQKTFALVGKWKELGKGANKITIIHPGLPNYVVKIPRDERSKIILLHQFYNIHLLNETVTHLNFTKLIAIPTSYLVIDKPLLVETRMGSPRTPVGPKGNPQYERFINDRLYAYFRLRELTGIRDVDINENEGGNAGFVETSDKQLKIGMWDVDSGGHEKEKDLESYLRV